MSLLHALIGTARAVRHAPQLSEGLVPDDAVLLDAPDERLAPALVSAALGDPEPAAKLLATTRDAAEWEDRDRYVMRLGAFAYRRDEWLGTWLRAAPRDPDALLVKAEVAVRRAWQSPARAEQLIAMGPLIDAAADGEPRDPVPWRLALDHARGTHAGHRAFQAVWEQAVERSALHYGCHVAALLFLSAQWYGSHRECAEFAERTASAAPRGSLVRALPLRAAFSRLAGGGGLSPVEDESVARAADAAAEVSARYAPGDPWPAEVRNLLAWVLARQGRWAAALEQFRLIGPCATSFPWTCFSDDPLREFLETRDLARARVASGIPLCGRAGRRRAGDHYA